MGDAARDTIHTVKDCFGCGSENDAGLGLKPWRDGEWIVAEYHPKPKHRGFTTVVHGGIIASVLDEVVTSSAAIAVKALTATVKLEIEFLAPMKLDGTFVVRGRYTGEKDGFHTAEGAIEDGSGHPIARARGRFVALSKERAKRFLG